MASTHLGTPAAESGIVRDDGVITMKNGETRSAVRYTYPDGATAVYFVTTGSHGSLRTATHDRAATFTPAP